MTPYVTSRFAGNQYEVPTQTYFITTAHNRRLSTPEVRTNLPTWVLNMPDKTTYLHGPPLCNTQWYQLGERVHIHM